MKKWVQNLFHFIFWKIWILLIFFSFDMQNNLYCWIEILILLFSIFFH